MTIITANNGVGETTPTIVDGYEATRTSRNIVHDLISGGIAVTLISPRPRSGTLRLVYATESDAAFSVLLHAEETTFTLVDDDRDSLAMTYVIDGSGVEIALDDESRDVWVVSVGFQEVEE